MNYLVDNELADWRSRDRNIEGLAEFFNNYKIPFLGFGTTNKNKQLYLKQMAEINEYVHICLEDLMYEKKEEKYKKEKESEDLSRKLIKEILNDLVKKNLVTKKKIQEVKDNLIHIYKDPAFKSLENLELRSYISNAGKIREAIIMLNEEKFDGIDRDSDLI